MYEWIKQEVHIQSSMHIKGGKQTINNFDIILPLEAT